MKFQKGHKTNLGKTFLNRKSPPPFTEEHKKKIGVNTSIALTGHKLTEEHRKKLSEVHKGIKFSEERKRKLSLAQKGKKKSLITEEHRKHLSESHIGKNRGENNINWKGGITPEVQKIRNSFEMKLWRKSNFERDYFTCQKCKDNRGGNLEVHHINNFADFSELRLAIDNGITFCEICHQEFHKTYGYKNNTKEQLIEFLTI